jgi:hypothetical protein
VNVGFGADLQDTVLFKRHKETIVYSERSEDGWVQSKDLEKIISEV